MKRISNKLVFLSDEYEIREGNIYSRWKESWEELWIVVYDMKNMTFVLKCLNFPLVPVRHVSEVIDERIHPSPKESSIPEGIWYDFIGHVSNEVIEYPGPNESPIDNIECYLKKSLFSIYEE